ncbi:MAG: hypothetical protein COV91_04465 [Candidatus Taylorbacteria bacterium CG11_big_fil_rev_8_21_14_0_20_46_11]|uniref:UPF0102 protein COV91_04465 n=1 Tax=Candidatus Taylorbacteria bacterium CG11_big_fil_rev_8_21_14_0_20_46_11 TaxID=1975025 RepID=A0A2H0KAX2_9BACT|nr:MAG: hypothetical protein COV91_04465 [Candidatus Taylorbacteria bacterium CG11_big_fil_rev_8_21_14_0_20_46_11]
MAKHIQTGKLGESVACKFLKDKKFSIICRNYRKKWGEIDIIAVKKNVLYFIEVKTVSRNLSVSQMGMDKKGKYRAEDNIHLWKLKRLSRTMQSYLLENKIPQTADWQFDAITVSLDENLKKARVHIIKNIIISADNFQYFS